MVRNYKRKKRPSHICSRGPDRRKREHLEDLRRWDVRDYIEAAVPDVDADLWMDDDEDEEPRTIPNGWAEVDPRDPRYTIFKVAVESKPGSLKSVQLYRGCGFPNTPVRQRNHWWYWLCPSCGKRCRYLHSIATSAVMMCRKCWDVVYRSQSKSPAQRQKERWKKEKHLYRSYCTDGHGGWYELSGGARLCISPPKSPQGWVPHDLLKRFHAEQARRNETEMPRETEAGL